MALFVHGDQFVGMNVNPESGDLVLRYWFFEGDRPDANGRGVTDYSIEDNIKASIGRPIIYAPNEKQGGTKGHTSFLSKNAYDYEIGRILRIERATKNLIDRIKKGLVQSSSSLGFDYNLYNKLLEKEKKVWVTDILVTNPTAKKIWLDPTTTHLIPRYISPSIIHSRNPTGDYTKVDKWVLDHLGIVEKPVIDMRSGRQIAGAAFGEDAKLRGACFGDKLECLNILQTSSSLSPTMEKCVSCPIQLKDRLSKLFHDTIKKNGYLFQSSSSSNVSTNDNNTNQQPTATKPANPLGQFTSNANVNPNQGIITAQDQEQTFKINTATNQFVPDTKAIDDYNQFGKLVSQWILENKNEVRTLLDSEKPLPNAEGQQPNTTNVQGNQQQTTIPPINTQGESQDEIPKIDTKALLDKLNITTEELKNMEAKDIAAKITEFKGVLENVLKDSARTAKTLEEIRKKEEVQVIEAMIPKETFTDTRGFNKKDYDDLVNYIHDVKDSKGKGLSKDIITLIGVGLITLKNKQSEVSQVQKDLKTKASEFFGATIKTPQPTTQ
jgi:hypothetical protein